MKPGQLRGYLVGFVFGLCLSGPIIGLLAYLIRSARFASWFDEHCPRSELESSSILIHRGIVETEPQDAIRQHGDFDLEVQSYRDAMKAVSP